LGFTLPWAGVTPAPSLKKSAGLRPLLAVVNLGPWLFSTHFVFALYYCAHLLFACGLST
jgi:hypothetical protein